MTKEQIASQNDIVEIINPLEVDYPVVWDSVTVATLKPGETRSFPRFIAQHASKHLIDRMIIEEEGIKELNNVALREIYAERVVVGDVEKAEVKVKTAQEIAQEKVQEQVDEAKTKVVKLEDKGMGDLRKIASALKVEFDRNTKKVDLIKGIRDARKNNKGE